MCLRFLHTGHRQVDLNISVVCDLVLEILVRFLDTAIQARVSIPNCSKDLFEANLWICKLLGSWRKLKVGTKRPQVPVQCIQCTIYTRPNYVQLGGKSELCNFSVCQQNNFGGGKQKGREVYIQ